MPRYPSRPIDCSTPAEIEKRSFEIIEAELAGRIPFQGAAWAVARRLVHTSADYSLLDNLHLPDESIRAGVAAIRQGAPVFTDTEMARMGMPLRRLSPFGVRVECLLYRPGVAERAAARHSTKARAAIELAASAGQLAGCILAVGNAPTALLALLDYLEQSGVERLEPAERAKILPALVIAMPVGFVNAAESKELLLQRGYPPCIAIRGRRGGSPLAAAAVNALAELAREAGETGETEEVE